MARRLPRSVDGLHSIDQAAAATECLACIYTGLDNRRLEDSRAAFFTACRIQELSGKYQSTERYELPRVESGQQRRQLSRLAFNRPEKLAMVHRDREQQASHDERRVLHRAGHRLGRHGERLGNKMRRPINKREELRLIWQRALAIKPSMVTDREREIAQLIAEGHTQKSMAASLKVSRWSVEDCCSKLFEKLGLPKGKQFSETHVAIVTRWAIAHLLCHPECLEMTTAIRLHD